MWEKEKVIPTFFFLEMTAIHISDVKELSPKTLKNSSNLNHNDSNFIASGQCKLLYKAYFKPALM